MVSMMSNLSGPLKNDQLATKSPGFLVAWVTTELEVMFQTSVGGTNCAINGTSTTGSAIAIFQDSRLIW